MRKPLKAALLSALIFPGVGHFYLKKHVQGAILACVAIACSYFLLSTSLEIAQGISMKIQTGEIPLDTAMITEAISSQSAASDTGLASISYYLLSISWLIGVIDSYRVARSEEKMPTQPELASPSS